MRKIGAGLDLAIAVALLVASEQLEPAAVEGLAFLGELGLDGSLRPVPGTLCLAEALGERRRRAARGQRRRRPGLVGGRVDPRPAVARRGRGVPPRRASRGPTPPPRAPAVELPRLPDLADVRGQPVGRYALEVAAAGGHHLLMIGPPGAGKTMLASRLPGLLPAAERPRRPRDDPHPLGRRPRPARRRGLVRQPPFRAPHHGASSVALVGGGSATMRPGEISAACNGVLFLDELAEFATHVLDALRQPLEEGVVRVARAAATVTFPARFLLVAAMNPCPCGYGGRPGGCRCSDAARARYHRRLSGPLLDRFDLRVEVTRPSVADLMGQARSEPTAAVREPGAGGAGGRGGTRASRPTPPSPSTASTSSRRWRPRPRDVLAQALAAAASPPAGCTGSGGSPARSPTCRAPAASLTAAHVATALSLRADAAPSHARPGPVGMTDARALGFAALLAGHPAVGPAPARASCSHERGAEAGWAEVGGDPGADPLAVAAAHRRGRRRRCSSRATRATRTACGPTRTRRRSCSPTATSTALDATRVAIVGTRRCTGAGAGFARELGRELTEAGVAVVSGLALGIDGASHRGVLDAGGRPIGVVGAGLDVVYPRATATSGRACASEGLLLSEAPLGRGPAPGASRPATGSSPGSPTSSSWSSPTPPAGRCTPCGRPPTASIQVMAVPGSVRVPVAARAPTSSSPTGARPVRDATDVLVALGLSAAARAAAADRAAAPDRTASRSCSPRSTGSPPRSSTWPSAPAWRCPTSPWPCESLLDAGWVAAAGGWYERVAA